MAHYTRRVATALRHATYPTGRHVSRFSTTPFRLYDMSWAADLPKPKSCPLEMSVQQLASLPGTPGIDYIVVDTRRTDIIGVSLLRQLPGLDCMDRMTRPPAQCCPLQSTSLPRRSTRPSPLSARFSRGE